MTICTIAILYTCTTATFIIQEFTFDSLLHFPGASENTLVIFRGICLTSSLICGAVFTAANVFYHCVVITLWLVSRKYEQQLSVLTTKNDKNIWMECYHLYLQMKNITHSGNDLGRGMIFAMNLEGFMYFVFCFGEINRLFGNGPSIANFSFSLALYTWTYVSACEFYQKVSPSYLIFI